MNASEEPQNVISEHAADTQETTSKVTRAMVPLDTVLYNEIKSLLPEVSNQIGLKVNMPMFLRKTIVENWKVQMERYRRLNPCSKKTHS
jgi:hypothetical protein